MFILEKVGIMRIVRGNAHSGDIRRKDHQYVMSQQITEAIKLDNTDKPLIITNPNSVQTTSCT